MRAETAGLALALAAAMAVLQVVLWLLARWLERPLPRSVMAIGLALPWLLLAPWIRGPQLLVPTQSLAGQVPGTPPPAVPGMHAELQDVVGQLLPWELEVRHRLAERRLPFWSDLLDGGSDLWSNPMAGVLSPIAALARAAPIQHHLLAALALKLLVAFQGAWVLARCLGSRGAGAFVAATSFALGGAIAAWALFPHSAAAAWIPWLVGGAVRLARRPRRRVPAATTLAAAALFLSEQPEVAMAGSLLAAVAALLARRRRGGWTRPLARLAAAGLLGAGLAAVQLVPFALLLPHTQRAQEHLSAAAPRFPWSLSAPATWFDEYKGGLVVAAANPLVFGKPYRETFRGPIAWTVAETGYVGLVAFLGLAAALAWRRRLALPLVVFALVVLLAAADFLPLQRVLHALPLLRLPEYTRFVPAAALALCVAGGLGIDALLRRRRARRWPPLVVAAALSLAIAPRPWVALLWALVALALLLPRRRAAIGLAIVLLLDLGRWWRWFLPRGEPGLFYSRSACVGRLQEETRDGPWRAVGHQLLAYPSLLPVFGIGDVRPHNALAPMRQLAVLDAAFGYGPDTSRYFVPFAHPEHPLLDFLNVRVVVSNDYLPPIPGMPVLPGGEPGLCRLYRNREALPRWFVPAAVAAVADGDLERWLAALRDAATVAVSPAAAAALGPTEPARSPLAVTPLRAAPGHLLLRVPGQGRRLLATSLPGPRGWRAWGGGRRLSTVEANFAFLGVVVPAAVSEVELRYRPPGLASGAAASLTSLLVVAVLAWRGRSDGKSYRWYGKPYE